MVGQFLRSSYELIKDEARIQDEVQPKPDKYKIINSRILKIGSCDLP